MEKYQDILRDQTGRNFAKKGVNTSLMMFPVRLETKIMQHDYSTIAEPENSLQAFQSLANVLNEYHKPCDDVSFVNVKKAIAKMKTDVEMIDMMYREDKAVLLELTQNLYNAFHTVELQDAFMPVITSLKDVTCVSTISDKASVAFLDKMEKITRMFVETVTRPDYNGWSRKINHNYYSQQAKYTKALNHFRKVYEFLKNIDNEVYRIPQGMVYKEQLARYNSLVEKWNKLLNSNIAGQNDANILLWRYNCAEITAPNGSPAYINSVNAHSALVKFVKEKLFPEILQFQRSKWNKIFQYLETNLGTKASSSDKPYQRYSILATRLLTLEILLAKYRYNKDYDYRKNLRKDFYKKLDSTKFLISHVYCNFYAEQNLLCKINKTIINHYKELVNSSKECNLELNIESCKVIHKCSFLSKEAKKSLCVRIYPDVVAMTETVKQINRAEYLVGKSFWLKYIFNNNRKLAKDSTEIENYNHSLWLSICDLYPAHRSAFILKQTFPKENYNVMCRKAKQFNDNKLSEDEFVKEIDQNFVNSFPTTYVDNEEKLFTIPTTSLLPDRFVLRAEVNINKSKKCTMVHYGHRLPAELQIGLDLNNLEDSTVVKSGTDNQKQLYLNGSLSWMTDYDLAEKMGMAISLPLEEMRYERSDTKTDRINARERLKRLYKLRKMYGNSKNTKIKQDIERKIEMFQKRREIKSSIRLRSFDFSSIYVYGINEASADECSKILHDLMCGHLYSDYPMDIISFETPSNILDDKDTEFVFDSSEGKQRERFKYQVHNCVYPHKPEPNNDLDILDRLCCFKESVLGNLDDPKSAGSAEIQLCRKVNELMIDYLAQKGNPLIKAIKKNNDIYSFVANDVLPRGPFPMLRISDQPYGILPICDFRNLKVRRSIGIVKKFLLALTTHWNKIVDNNNVKCYGKDNGDATTVTTRDYLDILNSTPRSSAFYERALIKNENVLNAEFFRGEENSRQIEELFAIANDLGLVKSKEELKSIIPNYDYIPIIDLLTETDKDGNAIENSVTKLVDGLRIDNIVSYLKNKIEDENNKNIKGIQLSTDSKVLKNQVIEFFDLFNYRLDAWFMGMLNNKLRERMENNTHKVAIGSFGWLFNLRENELTNENTNEYILAPSVNHAITGAVLRSSYNNSLKNGDQNYDMSVNLSSERVRSAIRIIEGIQNGLSLGNILGADLERFIHEAYKMPYKGHQLEMDVCIYPMRQNYPLVDMKSNNDISVINGSALLEDYRKEKNYAISMARGNNDKLQIYLRNWIKRRGFFPDQIDVELKYDYLLELIDQVDDEYDALTDVVLSESVYKLVIGNREASDALAQALNEMRNIPMPDVVNIPITSAQIDNYTMVMLDVDVVRNSNMTNILAETEPKVDAWIEQMLGSMNNIFVSFKEKNDDDETVYSPSVSLGELGISASEFVYLSADNAAFTKFIELQRWMKGYDYASVVEDVLATDCLDSHSLSEMQVAADEVRSLLLSAHALRNEEMVKSTGMPDHSVVDNMSGAYYKLEGYIKRMLDEIAKILNEQMAIQNPQTSNYDITVLPDDITLKAIALLIDSYRIGQVTALNEIEPDLVIGNRKMVEDIKAWKEIVNKQHSLFKSLQSVYDDFCQKLSSVQKTIAAATVPDYTVFTTAIQTLLVNGFKVVATFQPDEYVPLINLAAQACGNYFKNIDRIGLETLVGDLAQVEKPIMNLHKIRMFQKINDLDVAPIVPMQIVSENSEVVGDEWLGAEVSSENAVTDAFTYIVMNPDRIVKATESGKPKLAGLVFDHFVDRIPYRAQSAAVSFAYDQPDAEAPQTILLAVSTKDGKKSQWNEDMLVNSLKSAVHMIKTRTVTPDLISRDSWTSGVFPLLEYKEY